MKIELFPLEKVVIDGKEILLNSDQTAVESVIGAAEIVGERHYYYNAEMAIDYDNDGKVKFIEFLGGSFGPLKPTIYGMSVFDASADDLISLLAEKNQGEVNDSENGYSYLFLKISVGIYRSQRPCDIEEMIEEMKADGIPIENNKDLEKDKIRANHWQTIGVGIKNYYAL